MSVKLSQLKNEDMLLVGENHVISKEDYMEEIQEHIGEEDDPYIKQQFRYANNVLKEIRRNDL